MKLLKTKSTIITSIITAFTLSSIQSNALELKDRSEASAQRVINMSYNISDRLDEEAHSLTKSELRSIKNKLRGIRNILNGIDEGSTSTQYLATCVIVTFNSLGQASTRVAGEMKGSGEKILTDCKFLAKSQHGDTAQIRLRDFTIVKNGNATNSATCTLIRFNSLGQPSTYKLGTILSSSIQGLTTQCDHFAKEIFGNKAKSNLSDITSL